MLRHFDTHFFQVSGKILFFRPLHFRKMKKMYFDPYFSSKLGKMYRSRGERLSSDVVRVQLYWVYPKKYAMMTSSNGNIFRVTGLFVRRIHRSPVNSPHQGQWRGALMFSLICTWINNWVNNAEAGDLRSHRAHCDVSVMHRVCVMLCFVVIRCCPIYPVCASGSLRWHRGNHRIAPCECIAVTS